VSLLHPNTTMRRPPFTRMATISKRFETCAFISINVVSSINFKNKTIIPWLVIVYWVDLEYLASSDVNQGTILPWLIAKLWIELEYFQELVVARGHQNEEKKG
jgi:hypothetical protein